MATTTRSLVALVLGVLMTGLGLLLASRPLWGAAPLSGSRALDFVFAAFFILRGVMNLRTANRALRSGGPAPPMPPTP